MNSRSSLGTTRIFPVLVALACSIGASAAATASPLEASAPYTVVRFKDLNLTNEKDVAHLYQRITRAARWVCRDDWSLADVERLRRQQECFEATVNAAIRDVGHPALTAFHRSQSPQVAGR